jgi:hypothetical protein
VLDAVAPGAWECLGAPQFVLIDRYHYSEWGKENEMDRTYSKHAEMRNAQQILPVHQNGRGPFARPLYSGTVIVKSILHLCGLVVRVLGYRSRGPGSILGATRFSEK